MSQAGIPVKRVMANPVAAPEMQSPAMEAQPAALSSAVRNSLGGDQPVKMTGRPTIDVDVRAYPHHAIGPLARSPMRSHAAIRVLALA